LSAEPGCRGLSTMSTWPAVSAQKSGEPTQARISPEWLSSTTAAAWRAPRSARVSTVCLTSDSTSCWSAKSSEVRHPVGNVSPERSSSPSTRVVK